MFPCFCGNLKWFRLFSFSFSCQTVIMGRPGGEKNVVSSFQRLTLRITGVLDLTTVEKHPLLARLDLTAANGPADYKSASRLAQLVLSKSAAQRTKLRRRNIECLSALHRPPEVPA